MSAARSTDGKQPVKLLSVNLLMAIQWGKQAWDEISQDTIECFNKVGLVPDANIIERNDDDDPFEGEDMMSL